MVNELLKLTKDGGVVLCGRKTCCPVLRRVDDENITITDDDGNVVKMSVEQAKLIGQALDQV